MLDVSTSVPIQPSKSGVSKTDPSFTAVQLKNGYSAITGLISHDSSVLLWTTQ